MLADARRCSYFELGLPVLLPRVLEIKFWPCPSIVGPTIYKKNHPPMFHNIFGGGRGKEDFESALSCTPPNRFLYYMEAMHSWTRVLSWSPSHVVFNCCLLYWFYMVAAIGVREIFCQGGRKTICPKSSRKCPKFLQKSRKETRAILQQHRPCWRMKVARYSFSG